MHLLKIQSKRDSVRLEFLLNDAKSNFSLSFSRNSPESLFLKSQLCLQEEYDQAEPNSQNLSWIKVPLGVSPPATFDHYQSQFVHLCAPPSTSNSSTNKTASFSFLEMLPIIELIGFSAEVDENRELVVSRSAYDLMMKHSNSSRNSTTVKIVANTEEKKHSITLPSSVRFYSENGRVASISPELRKSINPLKQSHFASSAERNSRPISRKLMADPIFADSENLKSSEIIPQTIEPRSSSTKKLSLEDNWSKIKAEIATYSSGVVETDPSSSQIDSINIQVIQDEEASKTLLKDSERKISKELYGTDLNGNLSAVPELALESQVTIGKVNGNPDTQFTPKALRDFSHLQKNYKQDSLEVHVDQELEEIECVPEIKKIVHTELMEVQMTSSLTITCERQNSGTIPFSPLIRDSVSIPKVSQIEVNELELPKHFEVRSRFANSDIVEEQSSRIVRVKESPPLQASCVQKEDNRLKESLRSESDSKALNSSVSNGNIQSRDYYSGHHSAISKALFVADQIIERNQNLLRNSEEIQRRARSLHRVVPQYSTEPGNLHPITLPNPKVSEMMFRSMEKRNDGNLRSTNDSNLDFERASLRSMIREVRNNSDQPLPTNLSSTRKSMSKFVSDLISIQQKINSTVENIQMALGTESGLTSPFKALPEGSFRGSSLKKPRMNDSKRFTLPKKSGLSQLDMNSSIHDSFFRKKQF